MNAGKKLLAEAAAVLITLSLAACSPGSTPPRLLESGAGSTASAAAGSKESASVAAPAFSGSVSSAAASSNTPSVSTPQSAGSADKENSAAANAVLYGLFSAPDKELFPTASKGSGLIATDPDGKFNAAVSRKFGSYFTEKTLEQFAANYLSLYQGFAQASGATLQLDGDSLVKSGTGYDFTANVRYKKGAVGRSAKVDGDIQFLDDGKITSFRIHSDGGLMEWLQGR